MNSITRRIAAAAALLAAPALIALGAAGASQAAPSIADNGPSASSPVHHDAFPHQHNIPKPGTPEHHRHQHNR